MLKTDVQQQQHQQQQQQQQLEQHLSQLIALLLQVGSWGGGSIFTVKVIK